MQHISIVGLMGMASNTNDTSKIKNEFSSLQNFFQLHSQHFGEPKNLSMGMSGDYKIAIEHGSNMIRVGSLLFGTRN